MGPGITNRFFPAPVGARWVYEATTPDGLEHIEVAVQPGTRTVLGIETRIVHDTVYLDGTIHEDTFDWYAQDDDRNVWYLGEDTKQFENGMPVGHEGAWTAGVDGALPGVQMLGRPRRGDVYRQEFLDGEADRSAIRARFLGAIAA